MKKVLILTIVLFAFVIFSMPATTAQINDKESGYISVNTSTTKEISPNQAEITIKIETSDKSFKKASDNNKEIAKKVYSSLKSIIGANDYIKTSNYSARPEYIYTNNKRTFEKYVVSNNVVVRTKNIDLIPKLIDSATNQGATTIENLNFSSNNYDDICKDTMAELTKKAYSQASTIASSINSAITGIKSINANCNSENAPRPYLMMGKAMTSDSNSSTPIESGKVKLFVNIDASFYVK